MSVFEGVREATAEVGLLEVQRELAVDTVLTQAKRKGLTGEELLPPAHTQDITSGPTGVPLLRCKVWLLCG